MMRMLRLELRKTNIRPYCIASAVIFLFSLGLSYIFAYVPTLDSGSQNSAILFSTYQGIMSINGAIILMACSAVASAMGYRYVIWEYCGSQAILLFSYPVRQKRILWAKTMLLLAFTSMTVIFIALGGFVIFALTANMLSLVNDRLMLAHFAAALRNSFVVACLTSGIALCSVRIGFIRRSNSTTVISAIISSMLLANAVAAIHTNFSEILLLAIIFLLAGILLTLNLAKAIEKMEL